jgi:hypothetical protein
MRLLSLLDEMNQEAGLARAAPAENHLMLLGPHPLKVPSHVDVDGVVVPPNAKAFAY